MFLKLMAEHVSPLLADYTALQYSHLFSLYLFPNSALISASATEGTAMIFPTTFCGGVIEISKRDEITSITRDSNPR